MNVRKIVEKWLRDHGCDGLCCVDCGCGNDDLFACGEGWANCEPAKHIKPNTKECADRIADMEGDCGGCRGVDPCRDGCFVPVGE